jgi:hypothetical protein
MRMPLGMRRTMTLNAQSRASIETVPLKRCILIVLYIGKMNVSMKRHGMWQ